LADVAREKLKTECPNKFEIPGKSIVDVFYLHILYYLKEFYLQRLFDLQIYHAILILR
jgi:hypothetical protein